MNCAHLFSLTPCKGAHVSLHEVHEVYVSAQSIYNKQRREAFYACQGLDMDKVERIYPTLAKLEIAYDASPEPEPVSPIVKQSWQWRIFSWLITFEKIENLP